MTTTATEPLLSVRDLHTYLATRHGVVRAVDGVSFTVSQAEVVGVVGESGCGKTVTCRTIMGLMPRRGTYNSGEVVYHPRGGADPGGRPPALPIRGTTPGAPGPAGVNLLSLSQKDMQHLRGAHLAMIFQDPMTALNPVRTIGDQLIEAVTAHAVLTREQARERALSLLVRVGIPAPEQRMRDYPFQFSGGMLQRALIAIALASEPKLLLADEPTTSLDVIIQDQILSLLLELQRDTGMSMILVSHDLAVITEVCDRIIVMYGGQVVEEGDTETIIARPAHPYTRALLDALPQGTRAPSAGAGAPSEGGERAQLRSIPGAPPSLIDTPPGCRFAPRCPLVTDQCRTWITELLDATEAGHRVRCLRHEEARELGAWQASDSA